MRWSWPLYCLLLLTGCEEVRRPPGGGGRSGDGGLGRDSGLPGSADGDAGPNDAGFDDAGRPVLGDAGGAVDRNQFCAELFRVRCEANQRCCQGEGRDPSLAECLSRTPLSSCYGGVAFDDGRVRFDGAAAAAILGGIEASASRCEQEPPKRDPTIGTLGEGQDCSAVGADFSPFYACAPGLYCVGSETGPAVCRAFAPVGDSCLSRRCELLAFCDATGRCRGPAALGEACGESVAVCAEGHCSDGRCRSGAPSYDYCGGA